MIALIPARGGSKGLPGKNIKKLKGNPLIAYTIEAALQAKCIDRVVVSTDDLEIAEVSKKFGAEIPFMRPKHLASDSAIAIDTYIYVLEKLEQNESISVDEVMVLLPTCPLRNNEDICNAYSIFKNRNADSVVSYTTEQHPIYWHKYIDSNGRLEEIFSHELANRQEFRKSYYPNGAIYIFKSELLRQRKYFSDKSFAYIMPRKRSVDIDTLDDFKYAEFLMTNS